MNQIVIYVLIIITMLLVGILLDRAVIMPLIKKRKKKELRKRVDVINKVLGERMPGWQNVVDRAGKLLVQEANAFLNELEEEINQYDQ